MEKEFWVDLGKNEYKIPGGYELRDLTKTLFSYLGSTDPELRDEIAYTVYANWLKRGMYTRDEVRAHVEELTSNMEHGIDKTESDTVFLRSFSVLFLAEIVHNDNKKPLLDEVQIKAILAKGLWYLEAEKDPRGYIPVKGWAHALAHTADLMLVLGKNNKTDRHDLEEMLHAIAKKLIHSTNWVYIHGEDERLANAVTAILRRELITSEFLKTWVGSFAEPEKPWQGAYMDEGQAKAFHNVRNFLRSVSEAIRQADDLPGKDQVSTLLHDALDNLKPY
ncbi:MAG TPA: DUF2785 domain-containing protein [Anaerolineales bacterium]|nr:DUF2785 domain-containing protein [Anaerolineales bacterium]